MDSNEQEQIKRAIQCLVSAQVRLPMAKNIIEHNPDGAKEFLTQSSRWLDKAIELLASASVGYEVKVYKSYQQEGGDNAQTET